MRSSRITTAFVLFGTAAAVGGLVSWLWLGVQRDSSDSTQRSQTDASEPVDQELGLDHNRAEAGFPLTAAIVGGTRVSVAEVDTMAVRARNAAEQRGEAPDFEWMEAKRTAILERRIEDLMLIAHAVDEGIEIPPAVVRDAVVAAVDGRFGGREQYQHWLAKTGRTENGHRAEVEEHLLIDAVLASQGAMEPTQADLEAVHAANRMAFTAPDRVHIEMATVLTSPRATSAQRADWDQAAATIQEQMRRKEKVEAQPKRVLVREHDWVMRGQLDPALERLVFAATTGDVVGPVETANGIQLVRVGIQRPAGPRGLDEVHDAVHERALAEMKTRRRLTLLETLAETVVVERPDRHWYRWFVRRVRYRYERPAAGR